MKKQVGIWMDSKQAVIVFLEDHAHRIKKLDSTFESRVRVPGEGKWFTRMGGQFFDFSFKKKAHLLKETLTFFKELQNEISDADELFLFGPASKKNEFHRYLLAHGTPAATIKDVVTADSMTDNQVAARVKQYFENRAKNQKLRTKN